MKTKLKIIWIQLLCSICFINVSCQTKWQGKKVTQSKISKEIISMRNNDQKYRMKYVQLNAEGKNETEKFKKVVTKLIEIDRSNTERMEQIIDEYGWPTFDKVGEEASNAAWLIVQHADRNPFFQEKCLTLLKKELENNLINPSNYAYLYDRVQIAKGKKQLYATQSTTNHNMYSEKANFQPIENESNVQKRRASMHIEQHVEYYALSLNFNYTVPTEQEAIEKATDYEDSYKLNIKKAKEAMEVEAYENAAKAYITALESYGNIEPEDYVQAARAISLAKLDEVGLASFYLLRAVFMGYKNAAEFDAIPDFKYLKENNLDFWENDLMKAINR